VQLTTQHDLVAVLRIHGVIYHYSTRRGELFNSTDIPAVFGMYRAFYNKIYSDTRIQRPITTGFTGKKNILQFSWN
jgi:hypothetical protein